MHKTRNLVGAAVKRTILIGVREAPLVEVSRRWMKIGYAKSPVWVGVPPTNRVTPMSSTRKKLERRDGWGA